MSISNLPKAGADFRMDGVSGFRMKFDSLIRYGEFNNLQNNRELILDIFSDLQEGIRRYGKIQPMARRRAYLRFCSAPDTTRDDERNFRKILDNYK